MPLLGQRNADMIEDCSKVSCPVPKNALQDYVNQYTLEASYATNDPYSATINGQPITIPGGTINVPYQPGDTVLTAQSCQGPLSVPVPAGDSLSAIAGFAKQLANLVAQKEAQCKAAPVGGGPPTQTKFFNQQLSIPSPCGMGATLVVVGTLATGFSVSGSTLVVAAGLISSNVSQVDANLFAMNLANANLTLWLGNGTLICQWQNTQQCFTANCPSGTTGDPQTACIDAGTYTSNVSQADADAQALAAATTQANSQLICCAPNPTSLNWSLSSDGAGSTITSVNGGMELDFNVIAGPLFGVGADLIIPPYFCPATISMGGSVALGSGTNLVVFGIHSVTPIYTVNGPYSGPVSFSAPFTGGSLFEVTIGNPGGAAGGSGTLTFSLT